MDVNIETKDVTDGQSNKTAGLLQVLDEIHRKELGDLYAKYRERILAYIISFKVKELEAESLTQDVFTKLCCEYLHGRKIKYTKSYLFTLAAHAVYQYHRQVNQLSTIPLSSVLEDVPVQRSAIWPGTIWVRGEKEKYVSLRLLRKTIAHLPEKCRIARSLLSQVFSSDRQEHWLKKRPDNKADWPKNFKTLSDTTEANQFSRRRSESNFRVSDQQFSTGCVDSLSALQTSLADRTFLQVDQAALTNKVFFWYFDQRRQDPGLDCDQCLCACSDNQKRAEVGAFTTRNTPNSKHLTFRENLA